MDLNEQLKQLALSTQQYPLQSPERQKALSQLFQAILNSGKLRFPYQGIFVYHYEEIKQEALQNLFELLCNKIEQYDPERAKVITWCNFLLEKRFPEAISQVIGSQDIQITCIGDLDRHASPERSPSLVEELISYIESDPEFRETYIENHPEANFAALILLKLEGRTLQEMSEIFGISPSTIHSFFTRQLKRFKPRIQEYFNNI